MIHAHVILSRTWALSFQCDSVCRSPTQKWRTSRQRNLLQSYGARLLAVHIGWLMRSGTAAMESGMIPGSQDDSGPTRILSREPKLNEENGAKNLYLRGLSSVGSPEKFSLSFGEAPFRFQKAIQLGWMSRRVRSSPRCAQATHSILHRCGY